VCLSSHLGQTQRVNSRVGDVTVCLEEVNVPGVGAEPVLFSLSCPTVTFSCLGSVYNSRLNSPPYLLTVLCTSCTLNHIFRP